MSVETMTETKLGVTIDEWGNKPSTKELKAIAKVFKRFQAERGIKIDELKSKMVKGCYLCEVLHGTECYYNLYLHINLKHLTQKLMPKKKTAREKMVESFNATSSFSKPIQVTDFKSNLTYVDGIHCTLIKAQYTGLKRFTTFIKQLWWFSKMYWRINTYQRVAKFQCGRYEHKDSKFADVDGTDEARAEVIDFGNYWVLENVIKKL